ncbi:hypothetical protein QBC47DRAFT_457348 [Echria macrotheca]|uniref:Amidohydrolase-related domain-containing protein n=1 Tax=Echria macrotheca TaxID=438768 RepID=A0AAJ0BIS5_9PEZI|nr:hypothetical protein QBC47DRAFT_457348 [Echria macrotheca]
MHIHWGIFSLALPWLVGASSTLFQGGTIIAFDPNTESLRVIRNGSILVENDRIQTVAESGAHISVSNDTEVVDITDKILAPGQISTHWHGWQTAFKTLGSNASLVEYFNRFGEFVAGGLFTPEDVYVGQLAGVLESLNAGVTTILDHAHHTWSNATAAAGLQASVDSGGRVFWAYGFHNITNLNPPFLVEEQLRNFRDLALNGSYKNSPVEIGVAYDSFGPNPNVEEVKAVIRTAEECNASVITSHCLQGPWGVDNSPEDLAALGILNHSIPIVLSHASFLSASGAQLLRSTNQYISITPESEMFYGYGDFSSHLIQDQASLGVDTHFAFSADMLTQTRIWLREARARLFAPVLERWQVPGPNPMSVNQAFLLSTRHGGLALRREDLGVLVEGAKADLVVWNAKDAPGMLGWNDPVAAVVLHAGVGDVEAVMVDGEWVKKGGRLVFEGYYDAFRERFLSSARRIQAKMLATPSVFPGVGEVFPLSGVLRPEVIRIFVRMRLERCVARTHDALPNIVDAVQKVRMIILRQPVRHVCSWCVMDVVAKVWASPAELHPALAGIKVFHLSSVCLEKNSSVLLGTNAASAFHLITVSVTIVGQTLWPFAVTPDLDFLGRPAALPPKKQQQQYQDDDQ